MAVAGLCTLGKSAVWRTEAPREAVGCQRSEGGLGFFSSGDAMPP
jgi:hypothetical protein